LAGDNFGCGSSREHAPWALTGYGFRAVISTSFADIFRSNSLKNGLIPIIVDDATHKMLFDLLEEAPRAELTVDLATQPFPSPEARSPSPSTRSTKPACSTAWTNWATSWVLRRKSRRTKADRGPQT
jgi:3-isopropylmalate dehydratase small subunit